MHIYIMITCVFICIFNPYFIIHKLKSHLCARSSAKKRTIISVIRDGLIPFKVGYSILILFSYAFSTLSFSLFIQPPDHSLSFSLFHIAIRAFCYWRHESHNSDRKSSLWFLARHIRPHSRAIPLQLHVVSWISQKVVEWRSPRFRSMPETGGGYFSFLATRVVSQ